MHIPPPPPHGGGGGQGIDYLNRPLTEVFRYPHPNNALPLACFSPAQGNFPGGQALLTNPGADPVVPANVCQNLLSALASLRLANDAARQFVEQTTIRAFRQLPGAGQIALIDQIWDHIATPHVFNQAIGAMLDPNNANLGGHGPLPGSICPNPANAAQFVKRGLANAQPFHQFEVGFRIEGGDNGAIQRVHNGGMTQQRLNHAFMVGPNRGLELAGTAIANDVLHARVWTGNHDIFNETAVCVARSFFGATAFPLRDSNGNFHLWAVNLHGLQGFDVELHQQGLHGMRHWRPGEKAFQAIPANRVLGHVTIHRGGAPGGGGWIVQIPNGAAWVPGPGHGAAQAGQLQYMDDELAAWRDHHHGGPFTIPAAYDFAD
jgi:hypothetical protein